jgi:hypothetical protein
MTSSPQVPTEAEAALLGLVWYLLRAIVICYLVDAMLSWLGKRESLRASPLQWPLQVRLLTKTGIVVILAVYCLRFSWSHDETRERANELSDWCRKRAQAVSNNVQVFHNVNLATRAPVRCSALVSRFFLNPDHTILRQHTRDRCPLPAVLCHRSRSKDGPCGRCSSYHRLQIGGIETGG